MKFWIAPLAVLALAACGQPERNAPTAAPAAPSTPAQSAPLPPQILAEADVDQMACLAHVDLLENAIDHGQATGDKAALDRASRKLRADLGETMTQDELAQYYASSVAVFDDVPVADLQRITSACIRKFAPGT